MEFFDLVNEKGLPTGQTAERTQVHSQGLPHRTAHVWIPRFYNGRWQVLLQKRALQKDSFPGCYDTSSAGHIPAGSEPLESALRELKEELGIEAGSSDLEFIGAIHTEYQMEFHGAVFKDNEFINIHVLKREVDEKALSLQKEEIDSAKWFDIEFTERMIAEEDPEFCVPPKSLALVKAWCEKQGF